MNRLTIKNYEKTNYPGIYSSTYWGHNNSHYESNNIFQNRNSFIINHNIKKFVDIYPKYIDNEFNKLNNYNDHPECYLTNDNFFILLVSPYIEIPFNDNGWDKIYNLYSDSAHTYIKKIIKRSYIK